MAEVGFGDSVTTDNRQWNPNRPYQYWNDSLGVWMTDNDALAAYKTANPELFPASQLDGPQIGFGGSYTTPADNGMLTPTATTTTDAGPDPIVEPNVNTGSVLTPEQEAFQNQAFLTLLQQLGLTGLVDAYGQSTGVDVSQYLQPQYQPAAYQMNNMYQPKGMMTGQTFGVAPYRTGYLPPMVVPKSTVASDTGLLQYVMNQGQ